MASILARITFALGALALASCARACNNSPPEGSGSSGATTASSAARPPAPLVVPRTKRLDGAKNTQEILKALSKDCLPCAEKNGCLDRAQQGGLCEGIPSTSTNSSDSETAMCLDSLRCIFTTKCANTGEETPCLCGQTDIMDCMQGKAPPLGSCVTEFKKDFGEDGKTMYDNFLKFEYGAGQANHIIQCVMPLCPSCRIP